MTEYVKIVGFLPIVAKKGKVFLRKNLSTDQYNLNFYQAIKKGERCFRAYEFVLADEDSTRIEFEIVVEEFFSLNPQAEDPSEMAVYGGVGDYSFLYGPDAEPWGQEVLAFFLPDGGSLADFGGKIEEWCTHAVP